jgi:threonyl-tRNA synthetase
MTNILEMIDTVYKVLGFEYNVGLSTRPKEYMGTLEIWD